MVPVRGVGSRFVWIAYPTGPLPEPGLPDVTAIHGALLAADQGQCGRALTVNVPVAASFVNEARSGEMVTEHGARPSSLTATDMPAIVRVPVRADSVEFSVTAT